MTTYEPLWTGGEASDDVLFTLSPEDSPASRSRTRGSNVAWKTRAGSGPRSLMSSLHYDPATSSWKMSQLWSETESPLGGSSPTFTDSGSMRNGRLSPHAPWVHHIHETDCSLWLTPTARDHKGYTMRSGESICNQLRRLYGGSGSPNPEWIEWLMGYPSGWTELEP